ncbi:MAG: DUF1015 domain-containing protein [Dehalococcoidia bacterium]|nr:MAG: DUF1015 domain-containing protein [Dehalococcoidia bacterium]
MAEIRPFQGVRYNQQLVNDLSSVICPPYDIITPQLEQELYHRSEYNFVRMEHGRQLPRDTIIDNRYTRSAATMEQWLKLGVLKIDEAPAIYLHDHYFMHQEKQYRRRGIIVRVRLEEWDKKVIRPHEGTLAEPGSDRLSLLWALQANTSPILALYEDQGESVSSLLALGEPSQPIISLSTADGESHNILAITEPGVVSQIGANLARQPLYIADGHHRYESALTHQRERQACAPSVTGDEGFNFVMMTLVSFADPGLIILPPHRLVRGISRASLNELLAKLRSFFKVEELPLSMPGIWQRVDDLLARKDTNQVRLVLFGLAPELLYLLRLRDFTATSQMIPYFHCELYKRLDVSILDHIILEKLLGLGGGREEASLDYSYDKLDAVSRVLNQEYQLAFLLTPVKAETVKAVADAGDRMPRKSTYFYPKPPAGLVFHRLV